MRTIYCTYFENGILKKGTLNEVSYTSLQKNPNVSSLVVYSSELLCEQNYNSLKTGNPNQKKMLHG